ncbi:hypothetical protein QR680_006178 [Steinernema hermaphroditum]|uniref:G-protein coupled receptors family 1 profile domain-containing protein n=1 Tax=Steinernema hermaphroditum TaxID=289476 RepID=A0AA39HWW9_9BILA|nr:hypothetical protein QR680_006178 [Steinernema hermaphroditum]
MPHSRVPREAISNSSSTLTIAAHWTLQSEVYFAWIVLVVEAIVVAVSFRPIMKLHEKERFFMLNIALPTMITAVVRIAFFFMEINHDTVHVANYNWKFYVYTIADCLTFTAVSCLYIILGSIHVCRTFFSFAFPLTFHLYATSKHTKEYIYYGAYITTVVLVAMEMLQRIKVTFISFGTLCGITVARNLIQFVCWSSMLCTFFATIVQLKRKKHEVTSHSRKMIKNCIHLTLPHIIFLLATVAGKLAHSYVKLQRRSEGRLPEVDLVTDAYHIGRDLIMPRLLIMTIISIIALPGYSKAFKETYIGIVRKCTKKSVQPIFTVQAVTSVRTVPTLNEFI